MEPMRVTLGAPGRIMPPASKAVEFAQQAEADGFDAIWWPCHLMGWTPDSVWTEDLTALAKYQPNPHMYFEPLMMMGAAGAATEKIKVGVCVTDTIRRHPAMLAQTVSAVILVVGGAALASLVSPDPAVVALAALLMAYAAVFQYPDGFQALSAGALRGLKDTRVPMFITVLAYWGLGLPLGYWLGIVRGQGAPGLWTGLILGLSVAASLLGWRFWRLARRPLTPVGPLT